MTEHIVFKVMRIIDVRICNIPELGGQFWVIYDWKYGRTWIKRYEP